MLIVLSVRFLHVAARGGGVCLFVAEWRVVIRLGHSSFIFTGGGAWGSSQCGAGFGGHALISLADLPRNGVVAHDVFLKETSGRIGRALPGHECRGHRAAVSVFANAERRSALFSGGGWGEGSSWGRGAQRWRGIRELRAAGTLSFCDSEPGSVIIPVTHRTFEPEGLGT